MRNHLILALLFHLFIFANKAVSGPREDAYRETMKLCCQQYKLNLESAKGCYCREWYQSHINPSRMQHIRERIALVSGWLEALESPFLDPIEFNQEIERKGDSSLARQIFEKQCDESIDRYQAIVEDPAGLPEPEHQHPNCVICEDGDVNCVLQCGHTLCMECANKMEICPFCRQFIVQRIPMFLQSSI